jgi:hypothetical protein
LLCTSVFFSLAGRISSVPICWFTFGPYMSLLPLGAHLTPFSSNGYSLQYKWSKSIDRSCVHSGLFAYAYSFSFLASGHLYLYWGLEIRVNSLSLKKANRSDLLESTSMSFISYQHVSLLRCDAV